VISVGSLVSLRRHYPDQVQWVFPRLQDLSPEELPNVRVHRTFIPPSCQPGGCNPEVLKYTATVTTPTPEPKADDELKWLAAVQQHVKSIKYGEVHIIVHNGRVTQIERTEKLRFDNNRDYEI
jgi:hypothetical protein